MSFAPDGPESYLALGYYQVHVLNDASRGVEQYAKGQRLAPSNTDLLSARGYAEATLGRWQAAVEQLRLAEHLDPRSDRYALALTLIYLRVSTARPARSRIEDLPSNRLTRSD